MSANRIHRLRCLLRPQGQLFVSPSPSVKRSWQRLPGLSIAAAALALLSLPSQSFAAAGGPQWTVSSVARPTNFAPAGTAGASKDSYRVTVTNTGGQPSDGSPVTITDELPGSLLLDGEGASGEDRLSTMRGEGAGKLVCVLSTCTYAGVVEPGDTIVLKFPVDVSVGAPDTVTNIVRAAGGGALDAAMFTPTVISEQQASFGISAGGATTALSSAQAGAHPDLTTSIAFNTVNERGALAGDPKDTTDELPPGFAGDLVDTPACPDASFSLHECPINTQIGVTTVTTDIFGSNDEFTVTEPVYNLTPNPGEAAKLGFHVGPSLAFDGEVSVRPGDYGLKTTFHDADQGRDELDQVSLTIWGAPAAAIHDPLRWKPTAKEGHGEFGTSSQAKLAPFFTNPTVCGDPLTARFIVNSWEDPATEIEAQMQFGPITGCDRLSFPSTFEAEATSRETSAPSGLDVKLNVGQTYTNAEGLSTSTLKRAVVTLPEGMTVNPSAGAGLEACTQSEYEEESLEKILGRGCPSQSKLGTVRIKTPVLEEEGSGEVYIAQPYANPFKSLIALYVVARFAGRGVLVRVAGQVTPDEQTGRLVTTFYQQPSLEGLPAREGLPPLPFSSFVFSFRQGQTSPLVTPPTCGQYSATAQLSPWSEPAALLTDIAPPFQISSGPEGGPCPSGVPPFAPVVIAGTVANEAGTYSPMYIRVVRSDAEQEITRISAKLPSGLTANLTGVPFCADAAIELAREKSGAQEEAEPSCPAASQIGHTLVGAGVGSVLAYASGKVYMAGPYNGAPFSIVAITSAKVGPFDLGTVVVREALRIDPNTAVVTVDASASDPIPHIIRGIVVHVRDIRVYIDRPQFSLNPTSCERMSFQSTIGGAGTNIASPADDVSATSNDPFQAADCRSLRFTPKLVVSASGRTSRKNGASFVTKLTYPKQGGGAFANIRSVKVDLPQQLPSRLSTLQKACPDHVFNANPAGCPAPSRVGQANATTPILPVALSGPAYFVSHGGLRFPELVIVLQGYGITIVLHGETFISKGITSSTFRTLPDQPVTSFQLTLPAGPNSALAAPRGLCGFKLAMPVAFTGQNGQSFHTHIPIAVTQCHTKHKTKKKLSNKKSGRH